MVVVTSLFNLVILSFPDNMFYHVWTTPVSNYVQAGQLNHVQACQQPRSSWPAQSCSSLSTTTFKLASSTTFKPVNNHVQAGQLNHVQACQQPRSSWPAQPCSSLSTTTFKLASSTMLKRVNRQKQAVRLYMCMWRTILVSSLLFYFFLLQVKWWARIRLFLAHLPLAAGVTIVI